MDYLRQGFRKLSSDRQTYIHTYRRHLNYILRLFAGGQISTVRSNLSVRNTVSSRESATTVNAYTHSLQHSTDADLNWLTPFSPFNSMGKIAVARQLKDYLTHRRSVSLFSSAAPQAPTPPTAKINSLMEWQRNGRASSGITALVEQLSQTMILNYLRGSSPTYRTVRNQSVAALLNPALSVNDTYKRNMRTLAITENDHGHLGNA